MDHSHFAPETRALSLGYVPGLSEQSVKCPLFLTSTYCFKSAEEGKAFFELAYGLRKKGENEPEQGLIYSRINNPNLQIFEERMASFDKTEKGAVFGSGMAAISTSLMALVNPEEVVIATSPVYGGTHFLLAHMLPKYNIKVIMVPAGPKAHEDILKAAEKAGFEKIRALYVETPANPNLAFTDIKKVSETASLITSKKKSQERAVITFVDNTFFGPIHQTPKDFGADIVLYSATKFIGGHSDVIAGVATGSAELIDQIMVHRTIFGTMASPFESWMLLRSLETITIRMKQQEQNAIELSKSLVGHPSILKINHPSLFTEDNPSYPILKEQCHGTGSMFTLDIKGGEKGAFKFLNSLTIPRLAVSLGGTETLVESPMTMTHADVKPEELKEIGVSEGFVRISVGLENVNDLIGDFKQALDKVQEVL
eukprot:GCRY01000744.1.p1 GENE.GCRY01000744.1~~GCRY01000744.1.p1  ORF type:complete len:426 (+),score=56.28 GCRY01000744.1:100-1377(+)